MSVREKDSRENVMPSTWVDLHAMSNLAIGLGRKVLVKNERQSIASVVPIPSEYITVGQFLMECNAFLHTHTYITYFWRQFEING